MYVHKSITFEFRNDFNVAELESLTIEIRLPFTKPIILMTLYRPEGPVKVHNNIHNLVSNINILERNVRGRWHKDPPCAVGESAPPLALLKYLHMLRTQQCV